MHIFKQNWGNMNKVGVEEGGRRCRGIVGHGHHDVHGCVEVNIEKMTTIGGKKGGMYCFYVWI